MSFPRYIREGDELSPVWPNSVVDTLKDLNRNEYEEQIRTRKSKTKFNPFDVTSFKLSGSSYVIKLQPAYYYEFGSTVPTEITYNGTSLTEGPQILVESSKDLYFNYKDKKLLWDDTNAVGNLKVLKIEYVGGDQTKFTNVNPQHVDLRNANPFECFLSKNDSAYSVLVIPGCVAERVPAETGGSLVIHSPQLSASYPITDGQQLSVIVNVTKFGTISATPTILVETVDPDSTHYVPDVAGGSGQIGQYHYKLCEFVSSEFNIVLGGSHIDHFQDITRVDNIVNPAPAGSGNILKEFNATESEYKLRSISQRDSNPQIKITEEADRVLVQGNALSGSITYQFESDSPQTICTWDDGLHTLAGDYDVVVPKYVAGENVTITGPVANVYTVSVSLTSGSLSGATGSISVEYGNSSAESLAEFENGLYTGPGNEQIVMVPIYNAGAGIQIAPDGENEFTVSTFAGLSGKNINIDIYDSPYDANGQIINTTYARTLYFRNGICMGTSVADHGNYDEQFDISNTYYSP